MAASSDSSSAMEFEEGEIILNGYSTSDAMFDTTIGHIEDIIMDSSFRNLQTDFMNKYYQIFENTEENKFVYMDIFQEYTSLIEKYLERELSRRMENFSMEDFTRQLVLRRSELDGEVFEILLTFSDFFSFKEMFLDYKAAKEGETADLSSGLNISSVSGVHNSVDQSQDGQVSLL